MRTRAGVTPSAEARNKEELIPGAAGSAGTKHAGGGGDEGRLLTGIIRGNWTSLPVGPRQSIEPKGFSQDLIPI